MHFNVPQFIEVDDKIAFQLTLKQLGWFALAGVILFFIYQYVTPIAFFVWVAIIGGTAVLFAFYKPFGIPLVTFIGNGFMHFVKPRVLVWERRGKASKFEDLKKEPPKKKIVGVNRFEKERKMKESENLADILDKKSRI